MLNRQRPKEADDDYVDQTEYDDPRARRISDQLSQAVSNVESKSQRAAFAIRNVRFHVHVHVV